MATIARLFEAIEAEDTSACQALIARGVSPNSRQDGVTALHLAAEYSCLPIVRLLVGKGADVNARDSLSQATPLHRASAANAVEVAELLLDSGAEVDGADEQGETALLKSIFFDSGDVFRLLLRRGADVNSPTSAEQGSLTPLHVATDGAPDMVKLLIQGGAEVGATDELGDTPLHKAAVNVQLEAVIALMAAGAPVDAINRGGASVFDVAADPLIQVALTEGADGYVNVREPAPAATPPPAATAAPEAAPEASPARPSDLLDDYGPEEDDGPPPPKPPKKKHTKRKRVRGNRMLPKPPSSTKRTGAKARTSASASSAKTGRERTASTTSTSSTTSAGGGKKRRLPKAPSSKASSKAASPIKPDAAAGTTGRPAPTGATSNGKASTASTKKKRPKRKKGKAAAADASGPAQPPAAALEPVAPEQVAAFLPEATSEGAPSSGDKGTARSAVAADALPMVAPSGSGGGGGGGEQEDTPLLGKARPKRCACCTIS